MHASPFAAAPGDVRVETVPDAGLVEPTNALVRVTRSAICGSDLWPYNQMEHTESGRRMGHEFIGVVEDAGDEVRTTKSGDLVLAPFVWSDGTCVTMRLSRLRSAPGRRSPSSATAPSGCAE